MNLAAHIGEQAKVVNVNPTEGQKLAGNYRKGHIKVHGLDITIENPRGSMRSGTSSDGKKWQSRLPHHYGYVRRTEGGDGDHVDVFVGPHLKSSKVFVIDQHEPRGGAWDEHKCMIGFGSATQAKNAYASAFSDKMGYRRIGHVQTLTIEAFKDWLRDGDTKAPIKRAAGGRAMAEGGAPPYEPSGAPSYEGAVDNGKIDALARGAAQGATFNFADEIAGARASAPKWVPDFVGPLPAKTMVGAAQRVFGSDEEATARGDKARDEFRAADAAAKKNHPNLHATGELAGAIPSMAALPGAGAAARLAPTAGRLAKFGAGATDAATTGGVYGGLSGAGEGKTLGERAMEGAKGIVSGVIGGTVAHGVGEFGRAAYDRFGKPIVGAVQGWMNPNGEAARRLSTALKIDQDLIAQGKAQGMPVADWVAARQRGEPVTLAELGATRTQALLRSSANTSPEGRAQLEQMIEQRFLSQGDRVGDTVRGLVPGGANARKSGDQLVAEYDAGRVPAYKAAYSDGDREIMTPVMERLMGSPMVVGAMQRAIQSGQDRAITQGLGAFRPGVVVENGMIKFQPKPNGVPAYPNLQYWDAVKRELDEVASKAKRSGAKEEADVSGNLARLLRSELDKEVPSYGAARGIAEQYFGESNALEAGRKLAGKRTDPAEVANAMRKMKPDERALFQEGYASDLAERVIGNIRDTRDLTKAIFATPNERKLLATVFGPGGVQQVQNRMALEVIMDGARKAMGNSTTARQLIEAGLAGGAITGYASGWDPVAMMQGAGAGAGARFGAGKFLAGEMATGARNLVGKVDATTARRVAELLTSDDPRLLQEGYRMAAKNESVGRGLRALAEKMALSGQAQARQPVSDAVRAIQGPMTGRAEENQQEPEGVIH